MPGESHGQRSLVGYSPWGRKELDTTDSDLAKQTSNVAGSKTVSNTLLLVKIQ